jgi:hypothetical protein
VFCLQIKKFFSFNLPHGAFGIDAGDLDFLGAIGNNDFRFFTAIATDDYILLTYFDCLILDGFFGQILRVKNNGS